MCRLFFAVHRLTLAYLKVEMQNTVKWERFNLLVYKSLHRAEL